MVAVGIDTVSGICYLTSAKTAASGYGKTAVVLNNGGSLYPRFAITSDAVIISAYQYFKGTYQWVATEN